MKRKSISGQKFNMLLAISQEPDYFSQQVWKFKCDCGNTKVIRKWNVVRGTTRSCGCLLKSTARRKAIARIVSAETRKVNILYERYKHNAKRTNKIFDVNKEDFAKLIEMNCTYCGIGPSLKVKDRVDLCRDMYYNGIDRKDNAIGYVLNNLVTCCEQCNRSKLDYSHEDFINWIKRAYEFTWKK